MGAIKNIILGISIAVIFAFFIGFGIQTFFPAPEYDNFCGDQKPVMINTEEKCIEEGGRWTAYESRGIDALQNNQLLCTQIAEDGSTVTLSCTTQEMQKSSEGYCDINYYCSKEYEDAEDNYTKILFIITSVIGLITMIIGGFVLKHESVSPGLMGGGFFTILYGVIRYWRFAGDWLRFVILGIILAMLIYLGYKKLPFKKS